MNTEFLNTEILIFYLIVIISNLVIYLKSLFNLKIFIYYCLFCIISLLVSDNFFLVGMFISIVFAIYYFYIIPFLLKEEREEDEKITQDLEYFFSLSKEEKEEYYKNYIEINKTDTLKKGDKVKIYSHRLNRVLGIKIFGNDKFGICLTDSFIISENGEEFVFLENYPKVFKTQYLQKQ